LIRGTARSQSQKDPHALFAPLVEVLLTALSLVHASQFTQEGFSCPDK
jgi:hypothetical protein